MLSTSGTTEIDIQDKDRFVHNIYIYIYIVEARTQSQLEQAKVRELFIVEAEEVKVITQAKPRDNVELGLNRRCTSESNAGGDLKLKHSHYKDL